MRAASCTNAAASAGILTGAGMFYGAVLTAGSDAATLILYDNTSGTGTVICKLACAAASTTASFTPAVGVPIKTGIYAALTGTAPSASVLFTP